MTEPTPRYPDRVVSVCEWCETEFDHEFEPRHINRPPQFCSNDCRATAMSLHQYPLAGKPFPPEGVVAHASCSPDHKPDHLTPDEWTAHWFDHDQDEQPDPGHHDPALEHIRSICRGCPVQVGCLTYALDNRIPHGIYGGITSWERRQILRNSTTRKETPE